MSRLQSLAGCVHEAPVVRGVPVSDARWVTQRRTRIPATERNLPGATIFQRRPQYLVPLGAPDASSEVPVLPPLSLPVCAHPAPDRTISPALYLLPSLP